MELFKIYEQIKYYIIGWMLLLAGLSTLHYFYYFDEIHLWINHFHNSFFDIFFKYYTYIGNAATLVILILLFLFIRFRDSMNLSLMLALSTLLVQGLKHLINLPRPYYYFTKILPSSLHLVSGVELHNFYSFPSGHTTSAFVIFTYLSYRYSANKPVLQILLLLIACLVAFSRVYLSQHFLHDTIGGSLVGVLSVFIILLWTNKWNNTKWHNSLLKK